MLCKVYVTFPLIVISVINSAPSSDQIDKTRVLHQAFHRCQEQLLGTKSWFVLTRQYTAAFIYAAVVFDDRTGLSLRLM